MSMSDVSIVDADDLRRAPVARPAHPRVMPASFAGALALHALLALLLVGLSRMAKAEVVRAARLRGRHRGPAASGPAAGGRDAAPSAARGRTRGPAAARAHRASAVDGRRGAVQRPVRGHRSDGQQRQLPRR